MLELYTYGAFGTSFIFWLICRKEPTASWLNFLWVGVIWPWSWWIVFETGLKNYLDSRRP